MSFKENKFCTTCGSSNENYSEVEFLKLAEENHEDPGLEDRQCAEGHKELLAYAKDRPESAAKAPYCARCGKNILSQS